MTDINVRPKKTSASKAPEAPRAPQIPLLRGMKDTLPSEQQHYDRVRSVLFDLARAYGYTRIDTPILEPTELYSRAYGQASTLAASELFSFVDAGGDAITLRPDATPSVTRAYIEHGFANQPQPIRVWYDGPMFRREQSHSNRLRQFQQFGFEVLGGSHPAIDVELMLIGTNAFRVLGIPAVVQLNSIGCATCRPLYEEELYNYLKGHRTDLCEHCRSRTLPAGSGVLRVFDCANQDCRQLHEGAPQIVDWLCEPCKKHFIRVLEYLDELEVPYALSSFLVRPLDYYMKTVFEFWSPTADGNYPPNASQYALAGGGRYDGLIEKLGGLPASCAGLAFGLERLVLKTREAVAEGRLAASTPSRPAVYLAQLGELSKRKAMRLFEQLRAEDFSVAADFSKDALKVQLEQAQRLGVSLTLILGQKEAIDGTVIIREMSSGIQEIVAYEKVVTETRKRLTQDVVRAIITEPTAVDAIEATLPADKISDKLPPSSTIEDMDKEGEEVRSSNDE
ncbi:MAG: histidine--tRNA ligase [Candidatus Uhrbacteria bacterium]